MAICLCPVDSLEHILQCVCVDVLLLLQPLNISACSFTDTRCMQAKSSKNEKGILKYLRFHWDAQALWQWLSDITSTLLRLLWIRLQMYKAFVLVLHFFVLKAVSPRSNMVTHL